MNMNNTQKERFIGLAVILLGAIPSFVFSAAGDPEDPVVIAEHIQKERQAMDMPMGKDILFPPRISPGSGFKNL